MILQKQLYPSSKSILHKAHKFEGTALVVQNAFAQKQCICAHLHILSSINSDQATTCV